MPHEMFHEVTDHSVTVSGARGYTLPLSILAHALILAAVIVVPLLAIDVLPVPPTVLSFIAAVPAAPPLPAAPPRRIARPDPVAPTGHPETFPVVAPPEVGRERPVTGGPRTVGIEDNGDTIPDGIFVDTPLPPPAVPATTRSAPREPVPVGGAIRTPSKIKDAAPRYPTIAQTSRVEGIVILEATIDISGRVQDVKVLRSIPLLDAAAIEAVRQWEYTPTLLNGTPVPVIMTVTVAFTLR
jgi:protein TonB